MRADDGGEHDHDDGGDQHGGRSDHDDDGGTDIDIDQQQYDDLVAAVDHLVDTADHHHRDYVYVRRADYDNLVAALNHHLLDADINDPLYNAVANLIDHVNDDAP